MLTSPGEVYARHARHILHQIEALHGDLQDYTDGTKGNLRVFVSATAIVEHFSNSLVPYMQAHQDVRIQLTECLTVETA